MRHEDVLSFSFVDESTFALRCVFSRSLLWLQLNLTAGEELEIEYEVDGWFSVRL